MNLVFGKLNEDEMLEAFRYYYNYYTKMVGESIFSKIIRKDLAKGIISENVFYLADEAYKLTRETIFNALTGSGPIILKATGETGELAFYFRMKDTDNDEARTITVGELVGNHPFSKDEYGAYIAYLEPRLIEAFPELAAIDFEVPNTDMVYIAAALDAGYEPSVPEIDRKMAGTFTTLYEKLVREREEGKK